MEPFDFRRLTLARRAAARRRSWLCASSVRAARRLSRCAGHAHRGRVDPSDVAFALAKGESRAAASGSGRDGSTARIQPALAGHRHQLPLLFEQRRRAEGAMKRPARNPDTRRLPPPHFRAPREGGLAAACAQADVTPRFTPGRIRAHGSRPGLRRPADALSAVGRHLREAHARVHDRVAVAAHPRLRRQRRPREPVLPSRLSAGAHHGVRSRPGAVRDARANLRPMARPTSEAAMPRSGRRPAR